MLKYISLGALILVGSSSAAMAGDAMPVQALAVTPAAPAPTASLPANTQITLVTNDEITTKGRTWNEGDTFSLSVAQDVLYQNFVVIPRGSRAVGRISFLTNKGAFGKSGKMDIQLEYVEVAGRRIDIEGTYRQEGEGNTVATVGGVIAAGVFAGFITGRSARIPRGRELTAYIKNAIPLDLPADYRAPSAGLPVQGGGRVMTYDETIRSAKAAMERERGHAN